ncbi:hypothetical protein [Nonomuraea sp. NPDC046570]|uniref:hypothetical protein n=1 Tax=Nonomuraea sp. NPDC046570 TaxID=3155255 RepID=UPI0033FD7C03
MPLNGPKERITIRSLGVILFTALMLGSWTATPAHADVVLNAPYVLSHDDSVSSAAARLVLQRDGNLVVYDEFNSPRWASNTVHRGHRAVFQTDGNFVVYTVSGKPVWASGTHGHPGSRLSVQDDGNVVIYDGSQAIWATGTDHLAR